MVAQVVHLATVSTVPASLAVEERPTSRTEHHGLASRRMAYAQQLAHDVRTRIGDHPGLTEREMFGGIAFMIGGNMAVGVTGSELMVRVGKDAHDEAVSRPGARIFDFSARPMRGWIAVEPEGFASDGDLQGWVDQGVAYAESLPPK